MGRHMEEWRRSAEQNEASAFMDEAERAIDAANDMGFSFAIGQRSGVKFFCTQSVRAGNIDSIDYELVRITKHATATSAAGGLTWRIMCKTNHSISGGAGIVKASPTRTTMDFVCEFTV